MAPPKLSKYPLVGGPWQWRQSNTSCICCCNCTELHIRVYRSTRWSISSCPPCYQNSIFIVHCTPFCRNLHLSLVTPPAAISSQLPWSRPVTAAAWYQNHLDTTRLIVLLLTIAAERFTQKKQPGNRGCQGLALSQAHTTQQQWPQAQASSRVNFNKPSLIRLSSSRVAGAAVAGRLAAASDSWGHFVHFIWGSNAALSTYTTISLY
jgi:hypothetical protein